MDSFSQLWGRLLGKRPLCPRLSPGKTVEGLVGGGLTTVAVAAALGPLLLGHSPVPMAGLGALTAAGAVVGDLAFSWIKRRAGLKDFSSALPGHGGVLDRFDSLVVGAPVFFWSRLVLFG
jgi:phosphatidate cytidylyltransferase